MSLRMEFVQLAQKQEGNFRALCRQFGISAKTGYKWCARYEEDPKEGLQDRSRMPLKSPLRTAAEIESVVVALRREHPSWGGRKLHRRLRDQGHQEVPAPSTITGILRRHGLISLEASAAAKPWQRFEHDRPNALWQIDFKGHFPTANGQCHPLTLLDDHSRFNLTLSACARTDTATVREQLTEVFQRYGLPARINADNGPPWGSPSDPHHGMTELTVWLIRTGISVSHSRPYHPQTNGKDERFHRTLQAEVLQGRVFRDLDEVQSAFDRWRTVYNLERPHEALQMAAPISRYQPSTVPWSECLPPIEYGPTDEVVTVGWDGVVRFRGHRFKVSNALHRLPIAVRASAEQDGLFDLYFCHQRFMQIDLRAATTKD